MSSKNFLQPNFATKLVLLLQLKIILRFLKQNVLVFITLFDFYIMYSLKLLFCLLYIKKNNYDSAKIKCKSGSNL